MLYRRTPRGEKIVVDEDAPVTTPDNEVVSAKFYTHIHNDHVTGLIPSQYVYANPLYFDYLLDTDVYFDTQDVLTQYLNRAPTPIDLAQLILDMYQAGVKWSGGIRVPKRAAAALAPRETNVAALLGVPLRQTQGSPANPIYTEHYPRGVLAKIANIRFATSPNIHIPGAIHILLPGYRYLDIYMHDTLAPNKESLEAILEKLKRTTRGIEEATLAFDATYFSKTAKSRIPRLPVASLRDFLDTVYDKGVAVVAATTVGRFNRLIKALIDWFEANGDPPHPIILIGVGKELLYSTGPSRYQPWSEYYAPSSIIVYRDRNGDIHVVDLSRTIGIGDVENLIDRVKTEIEKNGGRVLLISLAEDFFRLLVSKYAATRHDDTDFVNFTFLATLTALASHDPSLSRCLIDRNIQIPKWVSQFISSIYGIAKKYGVGDREKTSIIVFIPYQSLINTLRAWSMGVLGHGSCPVNPNKLPPRVGRDVASLVAQALVCCIVSGNRDIPVYVAQTPIDGRSLQYLARKTSVYRLDPLIFRGHMRPDEILTYIPEIVDLIRDKLGIDTKRIHVYPAHADIPGILEAIASLESKGLNVGKPTVAAVIVPGRERGSAVITPVDLEELEKNYTHYRNRSSIPPFIVYELPSPPGGAGLILTGEPIPEPRRYAPQTTSIEEMVERLKKGESVKAKLVTPRLPQTQGNVITSRGATLATRAQPA